MKRVKLARTHITSKVDDDDFVLVARYTWYQFKYKTTSYAKAIVDGKWIGMHSLIFPPPLNLTVDHIDGDGLNNQKSNLRHATLQQQRQNKSHHLNSTSRYKGVSWQEDRNRWVAQICINGKQTSLGRFTNELEAARAYNLAAKKHFGEFAKINLLPAEGGADDHGPANQIC